MTSKRTREVLLTVVLGALSSALSNAADANLYVGNSGPSSVKPGESVTYVVDVYNAGPDVAADTVMADPTPAGLTFVSNTGDCTTAFPCNLGAVPAGQARTITAQFLVPTSYVGPDVILNIASATTSTGDSFPDNNVATAATGVLRVAGFHTLPPCRIVDTREAAGPLGGPALPAGAARVFNVRSTCGLPDNASSVSLNITVTGPAGDGDLRLYAGGTNPPVASAINYAGGQTRANNAIVPLSALGTLAVLSDQVQGATHLILDVNGYFSVSDQVLTPAGLLVRVRPAPEVELTFDNVTTPGVTTASVIEFPDNRSQDVDQDLRNFFLPGSPYHTLLPSVVVPSFVKPLAKGGPGGVPTFVLSIVDTTAIFSRTSEFHGFEDFRLGWDPPCVVPADPTQEPRTFYAREAPKNEPGLVEETQYENPVFVDISSGCGSNKGSGWNFSLYLTARDTRTPLQVAQFMLLRIQDAISSLGVFIDSGIASQLQGEAAAASGTLISSPASSLGNVNNFLAIVDNPANLSLFDNSVRNVRGEMAGRAQAARYMITKLLPTGSIVEFPLTLAGGAAPQGIAGGPDGNVWFVETTAARVGKITPAGVITEFPTAGQPVGIALGSDGNLWYTDNTGQRIGRVTPAGVITLFPAPSNSDPYGIAAGPDGNLWYTGRSNKIGKVTTAGVITEFPAGGAPNGIVAGPDGNLWFTERNASRIGRITTAGVITEFPTSGYGQEIARGPDGNLWFTETSGNRIGRITTAGVITEFLIPTANSGAWGITAAPDGNVWFTELDGNKVGRITTAGVITEFPVPTTTSEPDDITVGPDGNLWFTETGAGKIGRISP
jgi:uncharacterized repeat protein (TIGR01451 family)